MNFEEAFKNPDPRIWPLKDRPKIDGFWKQVQSYIDYRIEYRKHGKQEYQIQIGCDIAYFIPGPMDPWEYTEMY